MARKSTRKIKIKRSKGKAPAQALIEDFRTFAMVFFLFAGVAVLGGIIWVWRSGWLETQTKQASSVLLDLTGKVGFSVQDVLVEGRSQTQKDQILSVLNVQKGTPILTFDPYAALARLETLAWVKGGVVERRLPQTIFVKLYEREPLAIWQINRQYKLIDNDGHILRDINQDEPLTLPVVVGTGANTHAAEILDQLKEQQLVMNRVQSLVRVSDRRWNLHMDNQVVVKLPEEPVPMALEQLAKMMTQENILERRVLGIDLRLPDRMIVSTDADIDPPKDTKKKSATKKR
jgi:cell division protein FtsQ